MVICRYLRVRQTGRQRLSLYRVFYRLQFRKHLSFARYLIRPSCSILHERVRFRRGYEINTLITIIIIIISLREPVGREILKQPFFVLNDSLRTPSIFLFGVIMHVNVKRVLKTFQPTCLH